MGSRLQWAVVAVVILLCVCGLLVLRSGDELRNTPKGAAIPGDSEATTNLPQDQTTEEQPQPAARSSLTADADESVEAAPSENAPTLLRGLVTDRRGTSIVGAAIELWFDPSATHVPYDFERRRRRGPRTESDGEGRFEIEVALGRVYELELRAAGFAPLLVDDCIAGQELHLEVQRAARIRGAVVKRADDQPVPGGIVRVFHGEWMTEVEVDRRGLFQLGELVPGEIGLLALPARMAPGRFEEHEVERGGLLEVVLRVNAGLTVAGRVADAVSGAPIVGATVTGRFSVIERATTDAAGRYTIEGIEPERPTSLFASAPGYARSERLVKVDSIDALDFALSSGRSLAGRVVDSHGDAVGEAQVVAWGQQLSAGKLHEDRADSRTLGDGSFRIDGLRWDVGHLVVVRAPDHGGGWFPARDATSDLALLDVGELRLELPALFSGRLIGSDGEGVQGVIHIWPAPGEVPADLPVPMRSIGTDPAGRFAMGNITPGRYLLNAWSGGRALIEARAIEFAPGERSTGVELRGASGSGLAIRGAVFDSTGAPISEVMVFVSREDNDRSLPFYARTTTDDRGWFSVEDRAPGAHRVSLFFSEPEDAGASASAFAPLQVDGVEPGGAPLEFILHRLDALLRGRVLDSAGDPVARAYVWVDRGRLRDGVLCDEQGRFELPAVDGRRVELIARRTGHLSEAPRTPYANEFEIGRSILQAEKGEARVTAVGGQAESVRLAIGD